jgi:hypothetical protein
MKHRIRALLALIAAAVALVAFVWWARGTAVAGSALSHEVAQPDVEIYTPLISDAWEFSEDGTEDADEVQPASADEAILNCRFGYNIARRAITFYDPDELARLRASWFSRWGVDPAPATVTNMEYVQVVRLHQSKTGGAWDDPYVVPYTYTIQSPSGATLADSLAQLETVAGANPGLLWLIGNEMEREDWPGGAQDEMVPELYAVAYHQIYQAIKSGDPMARIGIGGVVQATPLRLQYLDRVWDEYHRRYGEFMPVDVWNIHVFVLREKRQYDGCEDCWGAGVPAGITDVNSGILYDQSDHKDFSIAREHVRAFRQWMNEKGERNKPLIVSEYGVLMPPEWGGFSFAEVRDAFMYPSFDMFLNEVDSELGYPADDNRLVQRFLWYSLDDDRLHSSGDYHAYNGWLFYSGFETQPAGIAPLGVYWENYVTDPARAPLEVDLLPSLAWTDPPAGYSMGDPVTMTLYVEVANGGSISSGGPFSVVISEDEGGPVLGVAALDRLDGCGSNVVITATWSSVVPGVHYARVSVDPDNSVLSETNKANNEMVFAVLVATDRILLPTVLKSH